MWGGGGAGAGDRRGGAEGVDVWQLFKLYRNEQTLTFYTVTLSIVSFFEVLIVQESRNYGYAKDLRPFKYKTINTCTRDI